MGSLDMGSNREGERMAFLTEPEHQAVGEQAATSKQVISVQAF